jgi:glycosyltransferase involved in cell wall biosynthesis
MMPKKVPVIATIHDTIIQHYADKYPQERSSLAYAYWIAMTKNSLKRADLIITVSYAARDAILEFCVRHALPTPRIHVTYEGAFGEELAGTVTEKKNYLIAFASSQPHKKILQLLEYWKIFEETVRDAPRLLLLGQCDHRLHKQAALCKSVDWTQVPSAHDFSKLMSSARGLIFPSEIEGFGLPSVEAYYHGTPVVYGKNTAVEEILHHPLEGGFQLDNFESFCAAVLGVLTMSSEVISKHALFLRDQYAWTKVAGRTLAAYDSL